NLSHKLAAGLTGCLSAKASGNDCNAGAIGATIGEMWGDYQVDDPNTLTQAQKDKLISQAKLLAAITAAYADEDVGTAASMAEEAVRWNGLKAVTTTLKILGKTARVSATRGRLTFSDIKDIVKKEGFDILDDIKELGNGELTIADAQAVIDLVVGTDLNKGVKTREITKILSRSPVRNIREFFNSPFGSKIENISNSERNRYYQGQSIYKMKKNYGPHLKAGDQFYLDSLHKDHLEVFDKSGNFKIVLNLDGSVNQDKTEKASKQKRKLK
ncbi:VENN motif pre-toxin domain-containing protein, partial [Moraxella sp. Tifton1]|uniref:VENN motif pre-toxin domain-containing protein n=1 Tax=Moraxella oculi TaxID=2940516 RepID=UPI0020130DCC